MPNSQPSHSHSVSTRVFQHALHAAPVLVALVVALCAVGVVVFSRDNDRSLPAPSAVRRDDVATTTAPTIGPRTEIVSRLREILAVQDRAIQARDAGLLEDIYSVDCKCLEAGRGLIKQLRHEGILWKGVKTSVAIEETEEVNDRLWTIVATVTTLPVRIETESGRLIRVVPSERNPVRFSLAKPANEEDWFLGHASAINRSK